MSEQRTQWKAQYRSERIQWRKKERRQLFIVKLWWFLFGNPNKL